MAIEKFTTLTSTAVPLREENVDTDQIIPARFLKAVERKGFGENLFRDWRFDQQGNPKKDFVLNDSSYTGKILLAGKNFGSGSSREHAAWALYDYGFRVVISSFFADIFKNNALNNGLLPIVLSPTVVHELMDETQKNPSLSFTVDLQNQSVIVGRFTETFEINAYKKECLLNGYDDIDFLLSLRQEIAHFESKHTIY